MKHITHLVFGGNALRTLCLCGVLRYIYCYNLDKLIRNVSGTSMGAFFVMAFALKIPIERLEKIIYKVCSDPKLTKINGEAFLNIIDTYGLGSSLNYFDDIREFIKETYQQDDLTFIELSKKTGVNLFVSATRVNDGSNVIFNVNDTPDISIIDAVAASMCVPFLSKPILIDGYYYIDGYLTNNFPIDCFEDVNKDNILGVALNVKSDYNTPFIEKDKEISFSAYLYNIIHIFYNNTYKLCYYNKITCHPNFLIINNSPIRSIFNPVVNDNCIDFSLNEEDINNLFLQGFKELNDYMNTYNQEEKEVE
jgi:NTE family protein